MVTPRSGKTIFSCRRRARTSMSGFLSDGCRARKRPLVVERFPQEKAQICQDNPFVLSKSHYKKCEKACQCQFAGGTWADSWASGAERKNRKTRLLGFPLAGGGVK